MIHSVLSTGRSIFASSRRTLTIARIHDVADEVVRLDREAGIFLPLVRIPDLYGEVADLVRGRRACVRTHPVELDRCRPRTPCSRLPTSSSMRRFDSGGKCRLTYSLPSRSPTESSSSIERALPARLQLRRARERARVEVVVLLHERRAQVRRIVLDRAQPQMILPGGQWRAAQAPCRAPRNNPVARATICFASVDAQSGKPA